MIFEYIFFEPIKNTLMTRYFRLKVLTTCLFAFLFVNAYSQDSEPYLNPKFGIDSVSRIQCANDLSTLAEFMKINLPDYALPAWRRLFVNCPASRKNIYISGAKIYQFLIEKESLDSRKAELFDTLMLIYDRRIEYFGDEGYVLGRKGMDIIRYNQEAFPDAYAAFARSAEVSGMKTDLNVLTGLIQTGSAMYRQDLISTEEFLSHYLKAETIFEDMIARKKSIPKVKRAQNMTEKIVMNSGIRDCEGLTRLFKEEFESNGNNAITLSLAIDLLSTSGCENSALFAEANERLLTLDPDSETAYEVAKYNLQNENYDKAADFLKLAVEYENIPEQKALYLHQLALISLSKFSNPSEAYNYAMLAIQNKPDWGEPYFILAAAVIEGVRSCDVDKFEKDAVYWLAVDYCQKAKSIDPTAISRANELIAQYRNGYPSVEETFFRSLKEGDSYKINCWINKTTSVKTR